MIVLVPCASLEAKIHLLSSVLLHDILSYSIIVFSWKAMMYKVTRQYQLCVEFVWASSHFYVRKITDLIPQLCFIFCFSSDEVRGASHACLILVLFPHVFDSSNMLHQ